MSGESGRSLRVLVVAWAWTSHYLPLVPLIWALRARGHDVRVASQPALKDVVTGSGATFVPAGADVDQRKLRDRVLSGTTLAEVPAAPPPGTSAQFWSLPQRAKVAKVFGVFAARSELMLDDTLSFATDWRPDLVVYEPTSYAGPLTAAALGVPAVRHIHGVDVTYQAREIVPELVAPQARRLGVGGSDGLGVDLLGSRTIDPCPPSMQIPTTTKRIAVRYIPYNGPAAQLPALSTTPVGRPRIALTWGKTTATVGGRFLPVQIIAATADLDVDVVATLATDDAALLGPLPDNVTVVDSLALHLLLPTCALAIHSGGYGTTLTSISCGVPQLITPEVPEQIFGAERVRGTGAAHVLPAADFTPETLAAAVLALLHDPRPPEAAARLQAEMAAQPSPAEIVPELEELVTQRVNSR